MGLRRPGRYPVYSVSAFDITCFFRTRRGGEKVPGGATGGGGGIRTHGTRKGTTVFETAPFGHSGTPPLR